jgi:hypothetical protein
MLPKAVKPFEEWFHAPLTAKSSDPRFEVRPAHPTEFERIYDLVDEVFGVKRPRSLFDWLYRDNPAGVAHCWIVEEKATGRLLCQSASWPWPVAYGSEPHLADLVGDSVVAPDWQRQGLAKVRNEVQMQHQVHPTPISLGWPNEKTRARLRKRGRANELVGLLSAGVFRVGAGPRRAWRRLLAATRSRSLRVEEVTRFDTGFDALTQHTMAWEGFWCPHDAEFLNWRYFAHPTRSYRALAALDGDDPVGYCVLRAEGRTALLMEFAAPEAGAAPQILLERALATAREAGCRQLAFHATPRWRHWPSFRSAGLADHRSDRTLVVVGPEDPDAYRIESWQILPGDDDNA